jgi:hypothetical protein
MPMNAATVLLVVQFAYGPFQPAPGDQSFNVAVIENRMLLAWSEVPKRTKHSAIHVALLDSEAQFVSAPYRIERVDPDANATGPVIATDGERFFVAWTEGDHVAGVIIDETGVPATMPRRYGLAVPGGPSVIWDGAAFRLFGDASYAVFSDGTSEKLHLAPTPQRIAFANGKALGWVDWNLITSRGVVHCGMNPSMCIFGTTYFYRLDWAIVTPEWITTGERQDSMYPGDKPAVAADGEDVLIVWPAIGGLRSLRIEDGVPQPHVDFLNRRIYGLPSAAGSLVVYEQDGDVYGVRAFKDQFGTPFLIAKTGSAHGGPRVYAASLNRYLVVYQGKRDFGYHLFGRLVTLAQ